MHVEKNYKEISIKKVNVGGRGSVWRENQGSLHLFWNILKTLEVILILVKKIQFLVKIRSFLNFLGGGKKGKILFEKVNKI